MDEQIEQATAAPGEKRGISRSDVLFAFLVENDYLPKKGVRSYTVRGDVGRPLEISVEYWDR